MEHFQVDTNRSPEENFMEWWRLNSMEALAFNEEPLLEPVAVVRFCSLYPITTPEELLARYKKVTKDFK